MAWPKGKPNPHGGRKKGDRNRSTLAVAQQLEELGFDPVAAHVEVVRRALADGDLAVAERGTSTLMAFVHPRLAAIDMKVEDGGGRAELMALAIERLKDAIAQPQPAPRQVQSIVHAPAPGPVIDAAVDSARSPPESPAPRPATGQPARRDAPVAPSRESQGPYGPGWSVSPGPASPRPHQPGLTPAFTANGDQRLVGPAPREEARSEIDDLPWWGN